MIFGTYFLFLIDFTWIGSIAFQGGKEEESKFEIQKFNWNVIILSFPISLTSWLTRCVTTCPPLEAISWGYIKNHTTTDGSSSFVLQDSCCKMNDSDAALCQPVLVDIGRDE